MNTLVIYDVDDTLFAANQTIYIRDADHNIVQTIDGKDYRNHMNGRAGPLPDGHYYCFSELVNGKAFYETKLPLEEPLRELALDVDRHKRERGYDVVLMTARGEVDYIDDYKQAFRDHNVDIDAIEIMFVGARDTSDPRSKKSSSECKRVEFEKLCTKYDHFKIYEDDYKNLEMFYQTALDFGAVTVELFHVNNDGHVSRYYV
jgi:hypothetical protein